MSTGNWEFSFPASRFFLKPFKLNDDFSLSTFLCIISTSNGRADAYSKRAWNIIISSKAELTFVYVGGFFFRSSYKFGQIFWNFKVKFSMQKNSSLCNLWVLRLNPVIVRPTWNPQLQVHPSMSRNKASGSLPRAPRSREIDWQLL